MWISAMAFPTCKTQGIPHSRATTAPCDNDPPSSAGEMWTKARLTAGDAQDSTLGDSPRTRPVMSANRGVQAGLVTRVTRISPACSNDASCRGSQTKAGRATSARVRVFGPHPPPGSRVLAPCLKLAPLWPLRSPRVHGRPSLQTSWRHSAHHQPPGGGRRPATTPAPGPAPRHHSTPCA